MFSRISRYVIAFMVVMFLLISVNSHTSFASATEIPDIEGDIYIQDPFNQMQNLDGETEWIIKLGKKLENLTKAQISVLIIEELDDQDIKSYTKEVFESYELGDKDLQNGVLVVYSLYDGTIAIEVGHGLKNRLTDEKNEEMLYQYARPYLKYFEMEKGLTKIYAALYNEVGEEYGLAESDLVEIPYEDNIPAIIKILIVAIIPIVAIVDVVFFRGRFFSSLINTVTRLLPKSGNRNDKNTRIHK